MAMIFPMSHLFQTIIWGIHVSFSGVYSLFTGNPLEMRFHLRNLLSMQVGGATPCEAYLAGVAGVTWDGNR